MTSAAVDGIALEISESPRLRPFSEPKDIPWKTAKSVDVFIAGYGGGKTRALLAACYELKAYVTRRAPNARLSLPVWSESAQYASTLRKVLDTNRTTRTVIPDIVVYCRTSPERWSASEKSTLDGELDSAIAFLNLLTPSPAATSQDSSDQGSSDQGLQLARERRTQLLARESWIDAPTVHLQQGGRADSQGVNNTASRLRRGRELLGAWNGREYLHPTFQFARDTGLLMPEVKELLALLPSDRSGWRQAFWLFQPHQQLDGARPADVFQRDPKAVIDAARGDFEISDERW